MLDLSFVRQNIDTVKAKVEAKGVSFSKEKFLELDQKRRQLISEVENVKSRKKKLAREIGVLKRQGKDSSALESESVQLSRLTAEQENLLKCAEDDFQQIWLNIPNLFDESVPLGKNADDNVVVREWGTKTEFDFSPRPHWELTGKEGGLDFVRAAKIAGARFALYFGSLARLERCLIQFMLDIHTRENGYTEVLPPFIANTESLTGTGNLPKFKEDLFKIEDQDFFLIPTAEVPLTNIYRDETIDDLESVRKYVAYTPCFRSEAGSYGKDVRGLIRLHQFNKVELLKFTRPERSFDELESLTNDAERILQQLGLPYRVVLLCSGDMSFSSAKTYDLEVWMPSRNAYVEISSCSNFVDFQARRARIKFRDHDGKKRFAHTLNGSGLAIGRTVAAIMENYQTRDGGIKVPQALAGYFPGQAEF